ncbi:MAG TPA: hypothetical protein VHU41_16040 [Thermoanaerobaculia bacterium]|nr:hypothetical protein [Thermoanaerobaculia bacterium]
MRLTDEAQRRLDTYLAAMRSSLRGTHLDSSDIEHDIREHIESALADVELAGIEDLDPVLARLGAPEAWISDSELPAWRRVLRRLQHGPEEWRLPYLAFAATLLGLMLLPVGIGLVLILGAFILARAAAEEIGVENLGSRRWLVYSPIALVMAFFALLAIIGPVPPFIAWMVDEPAAVHQFIGGDSPRVLTGLAMAAFGAWWIVLSIVLAVAYRPVRFVFIPLTLPWRRMHAAIIAACGVVVSAIGAAVVYAF